MPVVMVKTCMLAICLCILVMQSVRLLLYFKSHEIIMSNKHLLLSYFILLL